MELTPAERVALNTAMRSVGIAPGETGTAAQRSLAARIAREKIESGRPTVAHPTLNKVAVADVSREERIEKLEAMAGSEVHSPAVRKLAGRQIALMRRGMSEEDAGQQIGREIIAEFTDRREEFKAARAMRDGAEGPTAPIVRKAAQSLIDRMLSEDLAEIRRINKLKGY